MRDSKLDRRDFLQTCASAVAAGVGMSTTSSGRADAESTDDRFRLHYILASPMYGTTALAEVLPEVKKIGAEHIDIWPQRHANHREQVEEMGHEKFMALLDQHGVKLGMITRYDLGPLGLQEELKVVKKFGGRLIISGARPGAGQSLKEQVRSFVEEMKPHVAVAEQLGITIGIENHGGSLVNSPDSIRCFAEFARSPKLGIALAPYHLPQDEKLLAGLIEDLGPKMVHFYAWQHGMGCMTKLPKEQEMLQMPGRGQLDFTPLLAAMKKAKYAGWTEIFMHPVPRGIPILETTAKVTDAINEARDYLETRLMRPVAATKRGRESFSMSAGIALPHGTRLPPTWKKTPDPLGTAGL